MNIIILRYILLHYLAFCCFIHALFRYITNDVFTALRTASWVCLLKNPTSFQVNDGAFQARFVVFLSFLSWLYIINYIFIHWYDADNDWQLSSTPTPLLGIYYFVSNNINKPMMLGKLVVCFVWWMFMSIDSSQLSCCYASRSIMTLWCGSIVCSPSLP